MHMTCDLNSSLVTIENPRPGQWILWFLLPSFHCWPPNAHIFPIVPFSLVLGTGMLLHANSTHGTLEAASAFAPVSFTSMASLGKYSPHNMQPGNGNLGPHSGFFSRNIWLSRWLLAFKCVFFSYRAAPDT